MSYSAQIACVFVVCVLSGLVQSRNSRTLQYRGRCPGGRFYPGLGCFSGRSPFTNTNWLPQSPSSVNTEFLLYTRNNPTRPQVLNPLNSDTISGSHFDNSQPLKVLIHGFLQNGRMEFLRNMTRALLQTDPLNVLVVGWGGGAGLPYSQAVANTRIVGAEIARLLRTLVSQSGLSLDNVHLIGHSLGAHVAGYVGADISGVARITALDPAQPNFSGYPPAVRLDTTDARFVDVIHTDGVPYDTVRGYGMIEPVGHVDFYPNGGKEQPGCVEDTSVLDFFRDAFSQGLSRAETDLSCSHERSTALFTASVLLHNGPCAFKAFPCESEEQFLRGDCQHCGNRPCPEMGLHAASSHGASGRFYLNTTATPAFCGYHHFVSVYLAPGEDSNMEGHLSVTLRGSSGIRTEPVDLERDTSSPYLKYTGLVLTTSDLGEMDSVDVTYHGQSSYFSWGSRRLTLTRVEVACPMSRPTKYFCQNTMTVTSSQVLTLATGSFSADQCPVTSAPTMVTAP